MDEVREIWKVTIGRACFAMEVGRSLYAYEARRDDQAALSKRIKEIIGTHVR
ncbi:hypothetical protein FP2506_17364 [Fulvimarina pelagi HTCC2506]|uniref:Uncharacterized protein n=1 Tax=Fulvimarina pelagi HTCC2506 TaxID=314231 RepID=Q0FY75_9HYPH|nr:hypothetical protein FP2506_17364 [Fulvimarina pelagi HTCC2506]